MILDFSLRLVIYVKRKLKQVYSNASAKVAEVKKKDLACQFIDSIMEICLLRKLLARLFVVLISLCTFSLSFNMFNMFPGAVSCELVPPTADYVTH